MPLNPRAASARFPAGLTPTSSLILVAMHCLWRPRRLPLPKYGPVLYVRLMRQFVFQPTPSAPVPVAETPAGEEEQSGINFTSNVKPSRWSLPMSSPMILLTLDVIGALGPNQAETARFRISGTQSLRKSSSLRGGM